MFDNCKNNLQFLRIVTLSYVKQICKAASINKSDLYTLYLVPEAISVNYSTVNDIEIIHPVETCSSDLSDYSMKLSGCQEQNGSPTF